MNGWLVSIHYVSQTKNEIDKGNNEELICTCIWVEWYIYFSLFRAVSILRSCASTDVIDLLVARDITAKNEFKRLSLSTQPIPGQSGNNSYKHILH